MIERLTGCAVIVRCGVGFDHIDLAAAGAAGIPVCNTPDYGTGEVADHAIAMMLALRRGVVACHDAMRADPVRGFRLRSRCRWCVGCAEAGWESSDWAGSARRRPCAPKAFGLEVIAYDPYVPRGQEIALGIGRCDRLADLSALQRRCQPAHAADR